MAAPWAAGAQARIIGNLHGQDCVNVLNFATNTVANPPSQIDELILELAQALLDCALTTLLPAATIDYRLVRTEARRIAPTPGDPIIATATPDSVGELGVTSVSFASTLVHVRTGQGGARGRGKMFLPPAGEAQIAQSTIDGPTMVLIAQFTACLIGKFMGSNPTTPWRLGVLSQSDLNGAGGTFDNSFREATSLNIVANVAKMGSRKVGRGS